MLTAGGAMVSDLRDAIARDPEVRQARMIAEAARRRLVASVSHPESGIDVTEAQGMLDALVNARLLAKDAEDRVLLHRGLLTPAEAEQAAAKRRPASAPCPDRGRPEKPGARLSPVRLLAGALALALAGAAVVALARHRGARGASARGLRLPLARW